ncbi:Hypothetical protein, putative [Bodo saltans]|uniref:Uncharacterized protein n=1 Tax=Bodo saltans TaxID=75058 RepID=A0A0S4KLZ9_BODSA|nr:Hypothetical protein, putative [Bodo saltans]|eukprot:CUI15619.1 Hypothetical protein, putative [Bodo saltans]
MDGRNIFEATQLSTQDERMSAAPLPMDVSSLFASVLSALRSTAPPEQRDGIVFQAVMMLMADNWSAFDTARPPVQQYLQQVITGDITREAYVYSLSQTLVLCLSEDADVSLELVSVCREDADPLGMTADLCNRHFKNIVDGLLDFEATPEQPFSRAFRGAVIAFVGEWFDALIELFLYGEQALPGLLQHISQLAARTIAQRSPEHAGMAMMAAPMAMGFFQRLYREYKATQVAGAQ